MEHALSIDNPWIHPLHINSPGESNTDPKNIMTLVSHPSNGLGPKAPSMAQPISLEINEEAIMGAFPHDDLNDDSFPRQMKFGLVDSASGSETDSDLDNDLEIYEEPTMEEIQEWNLDINVSERVGRWLEDNTTTPLSNGNHTSWKSSDTAGIDYKNPKQELGIKELQSLALFDLSTEYSVTRDAHKAYLDIINSTETKGKKAWDSRTTQAFVDSITHIKSVAYDCCINSCMCFTGKYAALQVCKYCNKPRRDNKKPFKTFSYIPIIPRLMLQYSDASPAKKLYDYQ
jgi:hypothetical protein